MLTDIAAIFRALLKRSEAGDLEAKRTIEALRTWYAQEQQLSDQQDTAKQWGIKGTCGCRKDTPDRCSAIRCANKPQLPVSR